MRKIKFDVGLYYHVYNRGVDKREIFLENRDYLRFLLSAQELNTADNVINLQRKFTKIDETLPQTDPSNGRLVDFVCYCLMPNHFHFILKQLEDNGISKFMHKIGTSYTKYFNLKHKRSGVLFQGVFRAKPIETDEYLVHLSRYIHLNPLEMLQNKSAISDLKSDLKKYKWSSLQSYLWVDKVSRIGLDKDIVSRQFRDHMSYEKFLFDTPHIMSTEPEFST